jgi:hypothetical protein
MHQVQNNPSFSHSYRRHGGKDASGERFASEDAIEEATPGSPTLEFQRRVAMTTTTLGGEEGDTLIIKTTQVRTPSFSHQNLRLTATATAFLASSGS